MKNMKATSILSIFAAAAALILSATSCNKEENPAKPTVTLTEVGHDNSKTAMRGDDMHLEADILAEGLIKRIDVEIHQEDGSFEIDLNAGYYGELEYQMQYKRIKGDTFPWLYIDFSTLQGYAEDNGWDAELVCAGDHYDYLARITKKK